MAVIDVSRFVWGPIGDIPEREMAPVPAAGETSDRRASPDEVPAAWETFKAAHAAYVAGVDAGEDYALLHLHLLKMDAADDVLVTMAATTPAAAAMKLRRAFMGGGGLWMEAIALGDQGKDTRRQLETADLFDRMNWRAIEDLEAMSQPAISTADWDAALQRYTASRAAAMAMPNETREEEDAFADALEGVTEDFEALMAVPAPTIAVAAEKLRLAMAEEMAVELPGEILADLERLAFTCCK